MVEDLDELRYELEEDGRLVRRELDRRVLARGGWATAMFLYQDLDRRAADDDTWRTPRVAVLRLKKVRGMWRKHASFTLSGERDARAIADALSGWFSDDARAARGDVADDAGDADDADPVDE